MPGQFASTSWSTCTMVSHHNLTPSPKSTVLSSFFVRILWSIWDGPVSVFEHAPMDIFGNTIMVWGVLLLQ
eukprot:13597107-Ditylum_brightwellii.AAC.1